MDEDNNDNTENDDDSDEVTEDKNEIENIDELNYDEQIKVVQDIDIPQLNTGESTSKNNNEIKEGGNNNTTNNRHNLRTRKEATHKNAYNKEFQHAQHEKSNIKLKVKDRYRHAVSILMKRNKKDDEYAQVSLNKGINRFGDDAIESMMVEYAQIDEKDALKQSWYRN